MRHSLSHRRSVFFGLAMLLPACLLTADFEGLRGGGRDAGGVVSSDADMRSDEDAGILIGSDGGGDSRVDADASGGQGCQGSTSLFCADFDTGNVASGWTSFERSDGDGGQDPATYLSAPFSFAASTVPVTTSGATARLLRDFPVPVSRVHVTFGVHVDTVAPDNSEGEILSILFQAAGIDYRLYVILRSGTDLLTEYTTPSESGMSTVTHPLSPPIPRGEWTTLSLDVDLGLRSAQLNVGQQVSANVTIHPPWTSATVRLRVGLGVDPPAGAYAVHYDDVRFDEN